MTLIDISNEAGRVSIRIYVDTEWILGCCECTEVQTNKHIAVYINTTLIHVHAYIIAVYINT